MPGRSEECFVNTILFSQGTRAPDKLHPVHTVIILQKQCPMGPNKKTNVNKVEGGQMITEKYN